jgi:hypothetical protein
MEVGDEYYFNENVCKHLANYLKLYCKNNKESEMHRYLGTLGVKGRKYSLNERGHFGWWSNDNVDRTAIILCIDEDGELKDDVMSYNCIQGKWIIEELCSDVYQMWFEKMKGWVNNEGTFEEMKEAGYQAVAAYIVPENDNDDDEENVDEVVEEGSLSWSDVVDAIESNPVYLTFFFVLALYFLFVFILGHLWNGDDTPCVEPYNKFEWFDRVHTTDTVYCDQGVCYHIEDILD